MVARNEFNVYAKEMDATTGRLRKTRENEKHKVKMSSKSQITVIAKALAKRSLIAKGLSKRDIIMACLVQQFPLYNITWLYTRSFKYGSAIIVLMYYCFLPLMVAPIFMLFTFLSMYTRKGFMWLWNCAPVFKGFGYTFAMHEICVEIYSMNEFTNLSLAYIYDSIINGAPWTECEFQHPKSVTCLPMNPKTLVKNETCSRKLSYASQLYMSYHMVQEYTAEELKTVRSLGPIHWERLVPVVISWALMAIFMIHGIHRFHKCFRRLIFASSIYLAMVLVYSALLAATFKPRLVLYRGSSSLVSFKAWSNISVLCLDRNGPGSLMYITSLAPKNLTAAAFVVQITLYKMFIILCLAALLAFTDQILIGTYGIPLENDICVHMKGKDIFFGGVSDTLLYIPAFRLFHVLYYMSIFVISFASAYYTMIGCLESLLEDKPHWKRLRSRICLGVCGLSILATVPYLTEGGGSTLGYMVVYYGTLFMRPWLICLGIFVLTCIYTSQRLVTDYQYRYKEVPNAYWSAAWKLSPIIMSICIITWTVFAIAGIKLTPLRKMFKYPTLAIDVVIVAPLPLVMIFKYWMKWKRKLKNVNFIRPHKEWGPPSVILRLFRNCYDPDKEIHFKMSKVRCDHVCLYKDNQYITESKERRVQYTVLRTCMEEDAQYKEDRQNEID